MLKQQFREFMKLIGETEQVSDEALDYLAEEMQKLLEFDNVQNTITFKTGCVLQQLVLKNQREIREVLEEQLRLGDFTSESLPKFQFIWQRSCLHLEEDNSCKMLQQMKAPNTQCQYTGKVHECEIVRKSVNLLENWV